MVHRWHTTTTLTKCVVVWCCGCCTHNTIQQHILTKCVVVGTRNNTHNTIQQHILLKCVVVVTRNNTHNTIQQHTLLKCVVVCHLWTIVPNTTLKPSPAVWDPSMRSWSAFTHSSCRKQWQQLKQYSWHASWQVLGLSDCSRAAIPCLPHASPTESVSIHPRWEWHYRISGFWHHGLF